MAWCHLWSPPPLFPSLLLGTSGPFTTAGQAISGSPRALQVHALVTSTDRNILPLPPTAKAAALAHATISLPSGKKATSYAQQGLPNVRDHYLHLPLVICASSLATRCIWDPALTQCTLRAGTSERGQGAVPQLSFQFLYDWISPLFNYL